MPRPKQVKITKDGQEGSCLESSVAVWERHGWTRADDGNSKGSDSEPEEETELEAPAKKTTARKKAS